MGLSKLRRIDEPFSEFIRKRAISDAGGCEYCGRGTSNYLDLDCSHFIKRWKLSTRFDIDNASGICRDCHRFLESNPYQHTEFFKKRLGSDRFEKLNIRAETICKPDLEKITLDLKEKIKLLGGV